MRVAVLFFAEAGEGSQELLDSDVLLRVLLETAQTWQEALGIDSQASSISHVSISTCARQAKLALF